jgi:mono/diheme cytochrome c family protein
MPPQSRLRVPALLLFVGAAVCVGLKAQGTPLTATSPRKGGNPDAARIQNPEPATPESISAGRRTYQRLCVRCHGPEGKGDGGGAGAGGQPADFTDEAWIFGGSAGEIYSVIRDGTSADMDSYAEQISDREIWNLVNFLKSLAGDATRP